MYKIGDVVDARPDGSYIYMSCDGIKNLDNSVELQEAQREDNARLDPPSLKTGAVTISLTNRKRKAERI